ncbi:MAG TPA: 3'-5' exonuclease [Planctomycetota bacterium]|nr:3'-5' exonuclease [Planctomycetota bacterium]
MYLFFDTETTGLPDFKKRASDRCQPDMVELAALVTDAYGNIKAELSFLINPRAWVHSIGVRAFEAHQITRELCSQYGVDIDLALDRFCDLCKEAEFIVAHNLEFDKFIVQTAMYRCNRKLRIGHLREFCTMKESTNVVCLGGPYTFKLPKLSEAYEFFFNRSLADSHNAMSDVTACKDIFFKLKDRGLVV